MNDMMVKLTSSVTEAQSSPCGNGMFCQAPSTISEKTLPGFGIHEHTMSSVNPRFFKVVSRRTNKYCLSTSFGVSHNQHLSLVAPTRT